MTDEAVESGKSDSFGARRGLITGSATLRQTPPDTTTSLTPVQLARVTAALDRWYANPGGSHYRAPGVTWTADDYQSMHAALEAPTVDDALSAFGAEPGTWMTTAAQDAENRDLMDELRRPPR